MQVYKLDTGEAENIKELLKKLKIQADKVTIDLKHGTLKVEASQPDNADLLSLCGSISKKRADELFEHVSDARKEWDYDR